MTNLHISETGVENLDKYSRVARALIGAILITVVMTTPEAPLGWYAILPLLAIFPIFTAITGWDPIKAFFRHESISRKALHFSRTLRAVTGVLGVSLISSVYVASYLDVSLGVWTILPILGIYPVFAAIAGMDPIAALYNLDHDWAEPENVSDKQRATVLGVVNGSKTSVQQGEEQQHSEAA